MQGTELKKIEGKEQPVPDSWRSALKQIADAFAYGHLPAGDGIRSIDAEIVEINFGNIRAYPDPTGPLRDESWGTSMCVWMQDHWEVLVDLSTVDGQPSDLVLHAKVFELGGGVEIEPGLIYVP